MSNQFCFALALATGLGLAAVGGCASNKPVTAAVKPDTNPYPAARCGIDVDLFHGVPIPDPYRWLENAESVESKAWVDAQNRLTAAYVAGPAREKFKADLTHIWDYPKYTAPHREGDRYFFEKNDGLQNQMSIYRLDKLGGEPTLVLDPNKLSADGTVALGAQTFSRDGKLLAYGLSSSGSDRQDIHVLDIDTHKNFPEVLHYSKFTSIAWKHDNSGFYYNRFPAPGNVPPEDENNFGRVYWHRLGTDQGKDELVLECPEDKTLMPAPQVTDDGKYLVIEISKGTAPENRIWVRPVEGTEFIKLLDKRDAQYSLIDNIGKVFYFQTNLDAPRGKVIAIDLDHPATADWKTVVPQSAEAIAGVTITNDEFVISYLHDAYTVLKIHQMDGSFDRDLPVPAYGSAMVGGTRREYKELFLAYASFAVAPMIYRYDFSDGQLQVFRKSALKADLSGYETKQVFVPSKDGTKVPLFLTYRKGMQLDGNNPVLLYAYGGFDVNITPDFGLAQTLWLQRGGVYAEAVLRGGGEYGEAWHEAGMLGKKQNVFDDFQACGQWLVDQKYTRPQRLAIMGGSNGGLLTAACLLQAPHLFGAVVSEVPVIDMLRYKKFAAGTAWIPEYGDAEESPEMFHTLMAYSPLHNVKPKVMYPPVLVATADTDDRVDPSHSKKFVAKLQAAQPDGTAKQPRTPILLRVETKAGHGGGKPTAKRIEELADVYGFLFKALGME